MHIFCVYVNTHVYVCTVVCIHVVMYGVCMSMCGYCLHVCVYCIYVIAHVHTYACTYASNGYVAIHMPAAVRT